MKTQLVIVKYVNGTALVRHVVDSNAEIVFVASEAALKRINSGDKNAFPIGFRRGCVFEYKGKLPPKEIDWEKLKRWNG